MKKLLIVLAMCLVIGGCNSTGEEIRAAIEVCAPNGGLQTYEVNHSVVCANGVTVSEPIMTLKKMRKMEQ
jgi:hypothetical protein